MDTPLSAQDLDPASLPPGTQVGAWRVLERRGRGTYGAVYRVEKAEAAGSGPFALKLATHPLDPRFEREAELLSRVQHPNVPRLHARGLWAHPAGAFPYLVMDWVDGVSLYDWARASAPTSRQVLHLLAQVARALEATHAAGCVHRDVKGDNVLVRAEDGRAFLADFGSGNFPGARTLTSQPLPPGTPQYRSPEALRFQRAWQRHPTAHYEARSADDVFALGVTAYQLVTGTYPPPPLTPEEAADMGLDTLPLEPPRARNASVCVELHQLILEMLAEEPARRFGGSARMLAETLEAAARSADGAADVPLQVPAAAQPWDEPVGPERAPPPVSARTPTQPAARKGWLAVAALAVPLLALGTLWWVDRQHAEPVMMARVVPDDDTRDGGTVAVGDAAVEGPVAILAPVPGASPLPGLGLPMPERPFPGQRKAPCNRKGEVEIRGGCWYELARAKPPCDEDAYEHKGACFLPSFPVQRPSTSGSAPRHIGD